MFQARETAGKPVAVGVSDHAEEGEADAEELGGGVPQRGSSADRGGAVRSDVQPGTWAGPIAPCRRCWECWCSRRCSV